MNGLMKRLMEMDEGEETGHSDEFWMGFIEQKSGYILVALQDNKPAGMICSHVQMLYEKSAKTYWNVSSNSYYKRHQLY